MIKMIASDMDGTFLSDAREFDRQWFQQLLDQINRENRHFIAASGNQLLHLQKLFAGIEGDITYVAENGALIVEAGQLLNSDPIPQTLWQDAVRWVYQQPQFVDVYTVISGKRGAYTDTPSDAKRFGEARYFYDNLQSVDDLFKVVDEIYKIDLSWENDDVRQQQLLFNEAFSGRLRATSSGLGGLDVILPHVHKAYGLKRLQELWAVKPSETLAFGDNGNDIEMLELAKYGYAMKNAAPEVLTVAPFITSWDNNQNGVLRTISEYLNREEN